jgi:hypothetical protein
MNQTDITIDIKDIEQAETLSVCQDLLSQMNNRSLHLICEATQNPESTYQKYIIHAKLDGNAVFRNEHNLNNLTRVVNEKKEAGTLFPVYYFSLFPTLTDEVKLSFFMEDLVINANENYLRTKQIAIILDDEKNSLRMKGLLLEIFEKRPIQFLREITIFHFISLEK